MYVLFSLFNLALKAVYCGMIYFRKCEISKNIIWSWQIYSYSFSDIDKTAYLHYDLSSD